MLIDIDSSIFFHTDTKKLQGEADQITYRLTQAHTFTHTHTHTHTPTHTYTHTHTPDLCAVRPHLHSNDTPASGHRAVRVTCEYVW